MVRVEAAVSQGVMEHRLALLLRGARNTDDVKHGDVFGEGACDAVGGTELADTETDKAILIGVRNIG